MSVISEGDDTCFRKEIISMDKFHATRANKAKYHDRRTLCDSPPSPSQKDTDNAQK